MSVSSSDRVRSLIDLLWEWYGDIEWWPGTPEEVMIGAVLTQQTRWENVEMALCRLRELGICNMEGIANTPPEIIEHAIRPTGFFRVKTRRLKALASFIIHTYGGIEQMKEIPTPRLRKELLGVYGIGEETADSILCYALNRESFVIDAYTHRICGCAGIKEKKGRLKIKFEEVLPEDNRVYRQCHAHMVEFAKEFCGKKRCKSCRIMNTGR